MNRRGELDAIVVGAGAVGGAIALALVRDGFDVALVEAREPRPWRAEDEIDLRVVALAPDARFLLDDLAVWTSIDAERTAPYRYMRIWDALAPGELAFDAADRGDAALGWIVENKLIQHALWQGCTSAIVPDRESQEVAIVGRTFHKSAPRLYCPAEVTQLDNGVDAVTATLDDGTRLRAKLLIAAEGAESSIRSKLGIAFAGRDYAQRAIVAHVATERAHANTAWQRFLPGGPLAFLPLADGRSSIVWSLPDAEAARILALDEDAFRDELGCAFDFRLGAIIASTPRAAFPLRLRLADSYVAGRCVLAGDAAHVVHPLAGQGMNLGFRDVACLRRVLREARERGIEIGAAHVLRRYERERRSENALAARGLDAIERVFGSGAVSVVALRGLCLAAADRVVPLKHLVTNVAAGRP
jgi:2-octaprenyl-3-methyl-6-methoxy-1,4-benzoquinol hydroxylase/2-octaprenylphenol hydroxylase